MIIVVMLIVISLTIALIFLWVFFWNVRSGQYDDMITPSVRILFDDNPPGQPEDKQTEKDSPH
ncbi:MAG: cbb3-type cytochrome oxidase assembly protein CcoS [Cyclobacteriaceae bacterium]|nr:cbb3-type cytochrome oxidase assembly protein CcoS [Cyclobacteriaceae bacterium]